MAKKSSSQPQIQPSQVVREETEVAEQVQAQKEAAPPKRVRGPRTSPELRWTPDQLKALVFELASGTHSAASLAGVLSEHPAFAGLAEGALSALKVAMKVRGLRRAAKEAGDAWADEIPPLAGAAARIGANLANLANLFRQRRAEVESGTAS